MTNHKKYIHVERFGNDEVDGINIGKCHIFPKIDGTNGQVWHDSLDGIHTGSRNRELSISNDNAGFHEYVVSKPNFIEFFKLNPDLRLYGEWLVPHSLKTYRDSAWNKFYVFDVFDDRRNAFLEYEKYSNILEKFEIDYIICQAILINPTLDNLLIEMNKNTFLINDGAGIGEGIVIKNYQYRNRYGRYAIAKLVTNEFKEKNVKAFSPNIKDFSGIEQDIVNKYVTNSLIDKVFNKIKNDTGWNSKCIPMLLNEVYHDLITEELWDIIKKFKNPTIDFKRLNQMCILKIKELKHDDIF